MSDSGNHEGKNADELVVDTEEIVEWAKDDGVEFDRVHMHEQHLVADSSGREYLIRWQLNAEDSDARYETAGRMNFAVHSGLMGDDEIARQPVLPTTGERLIIAVVGTDTLGWIEDQLSEREGCCLLVEHLGDGAVWNVPFGLAGLLGLRRTMSTKELGLTRDSTFRQLTDAVISGEIEHLKKTHLPPHAVDAIPRHVHVTS